MELEIPKLSIQTLVENAIKHALEKVSSTVTIDIRAQAKRTTHAIISVRDNGPGFTPKQAGAGEAIFSERMGRSRERGREHWARQFKYTSEAALWGSGRADHTDGQYGDGDGNVITARRRKPCIKC